MVNSLHRHTEMTETLIDEINWVCGQMELAEDPPPTPNSIPDQMQTRALPVLCDVLLEFIHEQINHSQ